MGARSITEAIRPARPEDAAQIAAIYDHWVLTGTGTFETEPPGTAEMARRLADVTARGWPWLVLEQGGEILGFAYCGQFRDRAAYAHAGETSIYVRPDANGRGAGRKLLAALLDAGRRAGFRQFIAVIGDSANASSISLHQSFGFRQVGTLTDVGLKFGRLLDVVLMQLGDAEPR